MSVHDADLLLNKKKAKRCHTSIQEYMVSMITINWAVASLVESKIRQYLVTIYGV